MNNQHNRSRYNWEIRYVGAFGHSLYGQYYTIEEAKQALREFAQRCRENGVRFTGEIQKPE